LTRLAAYKAIEDIAEAVKKLPEDFRAGFPGIPWKELVAMRNRMVHVYDEIDDEMVWQTLESDIPELVAALGLELSPE